MSDAPLKEKPLNGESWSRSWHLYFDGLNRWVTGLISVLKFTDLTDVPQSYTGQAGKVVKVKGTEDGLEFGTAGVTDHTLLTNIGTNTHAQIDTAISNSVSHIADTTIHFTEGSIDHTAISNIGTNSHSVIDSHIGDTSIHFTESSIDHTAIQNIGTNSHAQIDTHIADTGLHTLKYDELTQTYTSGLETGGLVKLVGATLKTITKTYNAQNRISTITDGSNTWTFTYSGTGFLTGVLKT